MTYVRRNDAIKNSRWKSEWRYTSKRVILAFAQKCKWRQQRKRERGKRGETPYFEERTMEKKPIWRHEVNTFTVWLRSCLPKHTIQKRCFFPLSALCNLLLSSSSLSEILWGCNSARILIESSWQGKSSGTYFNQTARQIAQRRTKLNTTVSPLPASLRPLLSPFETLRTRDAKLQESSLTLSVALLCATHVTSVRFSCSLSRNNGYIRHARDGYLPLSILFIFLDFFHCTSANGKITQFLSSMVLGTCRSREAVTPRNVYVRININFCTLILNFAKETSRRLTAGKIPGLL